jgi:adenylosuccinate lyase
MNRNTLLAISPVDGRYYNKVENLWKYFSEFALIKYRVYVEIEYFIALCEIPLPQLENISKNQLDALREFHLQFTPEDAMRVKEIENITNHDVKAVEYFIKKNLTIPALASIKSLFISLLHRRMQTIPHCHYPFLRRSMLNITR